MVTLELDVISCMMYIELLLSMALFFCLQIAALTRSSKLIDWLAYRATWWAVASQFAVLTIVGTLVWNVPTDPVTVGHTVLLSLLNTTWFVTLRVIFEFVDYLEYRRNRA
jgi:hypothetical protein